jgi:hypothetical protein
MLVECSSYADVERFCALWDNIYDCACGYNRFHGNDVTVIKPEDADQGLRTLRISIWPTMHNATQLL